MRRSIFDSSCSLAANTGTSELFERPIARLGCGIHQCMPSFRTLTHSSHHRLIAKSLGCGKPRVTQSQLIAKLAGVGGPIVPHQDGCISFTKPTSGLTFWYALEDATVENGCLSVAPGSHLTEPLSQRLTKGDIGLPKFEDLKEPLWAEGGGEKGSKVRPLKYEYRPLEVKRGALVVFHGIWCIQVRPTRARRVELRIPFQLLMARQSVPRTVIWNLWGGGEYESLWETSNTCGWVIIARPAHHITEDKLRKYGKIQKIAGPRLQG